MKDRIPCVVPFCRRTASRERFPDATEIICAKHWRLAPKRLRRLYGGVVRTLKRAPKWKVMGPWGSRKYRQGLRLWERIKAECIEAAGATL